MQLASQPVTDAKADLFRIIDLIAAQPPDWGELLRQARRRATLVTFVNPLSLATARGRPGFIDELGHFDLVYPDSILVAKLASALRKEPVARRSFDGNSLAPTALDLCRERSLSVALVGGRPGVAERAGRGFATGFGARVCLTATGHFRDQRHRRDILRASCRVERSAA